MHRVDASVNAKLVIVNVASISFPSLSMSERRKESAGPESRPSGPISQGADRLVELIDGERARLLKLYHASLKTIEQRVFEAKANTEAKLLTASRKIQEQQVKIDELTEQLRNATAQNAEREREHAALVQEHQQLKLSLQQVGLVYVNGAIGFHDNTAHIVDDFVAGARVQNERLAGVELAVPNDQMLYNPVGPAEIWSVLANVLEKGPRQPL